MQSFFQNEIKSEGRLFREIEEACEGLIYISETDSPLLAFSCPAAGGLTAESILQQTGRGPEEAIEEISFGDFFSRLTAVKDWFGEPEKARAKKFLDLQRLLEENLRHLSVFRIGRIRIDIFVLGLEPDGDLMGVTTKSVET